MKPFDVILMNPPYDQTLYLKFLEKELEISNNIISINPAALIKRDSKHFDKYKQKFADYLYDIEELDAKDIFKDTSQGSVCIMSFKQSKKNLHIKYLDGREETINSILEKDNSGFTDYEKEIVKYLYNEKPNYQNGAVIHDKRGHGISPKLHLEQYVNFILTKLPDDKVYMVVNCTGVPGKGIWINKNIGQIFDNKEELSKCLYDFKGKQYHYMYFDSIESAKNCKSAMKRPLLRFTLVRSQKNQSLRGAQYKYIPDIDWSDERVKTDEGLLEICGCTKDKAKEYANYCNKIIEQVDKK